MADIILNKPEAGTQAVFEAAGDSRIDLNFPTDQATLERSGNDLIFRFDDGSTVVLRDFYTAYTKDSMPDFVIEGTPIAGDQFFTALNEPDLMPAAGPAANAASADGGRFREYADDALINGVNRLDGLDLSLSLIHIFSNTWFNNNGYIGKCGYPHFACSSARHSRASSMHSSSTAPAGLSPSYTN